MGAIWQAEADKHVNEPVVLCELALTSGTLLWSTDFVRPKTSNPYVGQIISLPIISNSIGDLARTFECGTVKITLADPERLLRQATSAEGIKNKALTIKISFPDNALGEALTVFTGRVYRYQPLANLQYEIEAEPILKNMAEVYPDKTVNSTDYAAAFSGALEQVIPIIWGSNTSTSGPCKTLMVVETQDAEKHLVGLQQGAALTVTNVRLNGILKTVDTHYTITNATIDGKVHTYIKWVALVRPTSSDLVTCDAAANDATMGPVEAIKYFMINFCGYVDGDFNDASYDLAVTEEASRNYTFDGIMGSQKTLAAWLDQIRNEFELDVWFDMATGKIKFHYLGQAIDTATALWFYDYLDIINYVPSQKVDLIMNWCRPGYNYDYAQQNFQNYSFAEDAASQTEHGGTYKEYPTAYFIRVAATSTDIAVRKVTRQRNPLAFETFVLPLKAFSLGLATISRFTHFDGAGVDGYQGEFFQLRTAELDLNQFVFSGTFENVSSFYGAEMILGDETAIGELWTDVDADEFYAYMADETTEEFSDGDPGKRMNDD